MNIPVPEGMERKKFFLLLSVIIVCGLLTIKGVAERLWSDNSVPVPSSQQQEVHVATEKAPLPPPNNGAAPKGSRLSTQLAVLQQKNPFIDPTALPKQSRNDALPAIPQTAPAPVGNVPVPAIPRQPVQPPAGMAGEKAAIGVKGVLTGGRNGNMAIMSDGTVVTEGDTYQDQRIAYIGGDGLTFDDGHHLDYK